ncbi:MAG: integrase, partial [Alphaproteobacteria bacterium]|nr:integrase [Alphaproteobacteria bacterium]
MASIRKRGDKWQAQVRLEGYPQTSKSFMLRVDAERWARQTEAAIERGEHSLDVRQTKSITLEDILVRYRESVTVHKRGALPECYRIETMLKHPVSRRSLASLTSADIAKYRDDRLDRVASASVRRELVILRHCFEVACKEWSMPRLSNPVALIRMPTGAKVRQRRLEGDELERLLEGCSQGRSPLLPFVIQFAVHTGMRRGEILSLRWCDVSLDCATLCIPMSKNGQERTIPLTTGAIGILKDTPREREEVFPISANALQLAWGRLR